MKQWEYLTINALPRSLQTLGNEGWELVTVIQHPARSEGSPGTLLTYFFKREREIPVQVGGGK